MTVQFKPVMSPDYERNVALIEAEQERRAAAERKAAYAAIDRETRERVHRNRNTGESPHRRRK